MDWRYHPRSANYSKPAYNKWEMKYFIKNKKVCMKPLRSRLEAIQRLQPPKTPKGCRSFAGVVNFLSMFSRATKTS